MTHLEWTEIHIPCQTQLLGHGSTVDWHVGVRRKTWTGYAASPMLLRYSIGLREPSEILILSSLYQWM